MSGSLTLNPTQTKRFVIAIALLVAALTAGSVWWGVTHPTPKSLQVMSPAVTPGGPATVRATLAVEGMSCEGCVATIKTAMKKLAVDDVQISLEEKRVVVVFRTDKTSLGDILSKIQEAGYTPKLLE
jgi:copper chaperone CopZ